MAKRLEAVALPAAGVSMDTSGIFYVDGSRSGPRNISLSISSAFKHFLRINDCLTPQTPPTRGLHPGFRGLSPVFLWPIQFLLL